MIVSGKGAALRLSCCIASPTDSPQIPNFELLGRIGGGSYGEVFLARSITGMYRAVKVVRREDFEFERTFEREFEGIQRYEKVSQNHPGLVDVLHVGRNSEGGFYYYVMELADDYSWALVGSKTDKYLWILSRTPSLDTNTIEHILRLAANRGYDTSKILWVEQN